MSAWVNMDIRGPKIPSHASGNASPDPVMDYRRGWNESWDLKKESERKDVSGCNAVMSMAVGPGTHHWFSILIPSGTRTDHEIRRSMLARTEADLEIR